ncbi:MAG: methyl-coenzyme M reductase-associated protein Mmp3 [Candidatus Methanofastidiosia archaeon]
MKVIIDNKEIDTNVSSVSKLIGFLPSQNMPVLIKRKTAKKIIEKNTFDIGTTRGNMAVEIYENKFSSFFEKNLDMFTDLPLLWTDKNNANFGTFELNFLPTRKNFDYERYDVLFGLSGFEKTKGVLTFAKKGYIGKNGIEKSTFGKVTEGKHILEKLKATDRILTIQKRLVRSQMFDYKIVTDDKEKIRNKDHIITKIVIALDKKNPYACEHFLFLTKNGFFEVAENTNTYCKNNALIGIDLLKENIKPRSRGSVSVRIKGKEKGNVYIYLHDTIEDESHTVFGKVMHGLELAEHLKNGQMLRVKTDIKRINTLGLTQKMAGKVAEKHNLYQQRDGDVSDDAIVIRQEPELSIEAIKQDNIITEGIKPDNVFKIHLYEKEAPESVRYFKTITGLRTRDIGQIKIFFSDPGLDMILFSGNTNLGRDLKPENTPKDTVKAGEIGITNMASRQMGIVGLRFNDNDRFGPTGEDFSQTNMAGYFKDYEKLKNTKEKTIFLILED